MYMFIFLGACKWLAHRPQKRVFLRNFHAWMITTPIEEVMIQSHTLLFDVAFKAFLFSILLSVLINLKDVLLAH